MEKLLTMPQPLSQLITKHYQTIKKLHNLKPSVVVNQAFDQLVSIIYSHENEHTAYQLDCMLCQIGSLLPDLQHLCSQAEYELEKYWSKKIADQPETVIEFPYYKHYQKLIKWEQKITSNTDQKTLFIGAGPLPLSAILWHKNGKSQIDCIDKDPVACRLGGACIKALNHKVNYICSDIYQHTNFAYDLIILGALVGETNEQKQIILDHIAQYTAPQTKVLVRSSKGLRQLLYPALETIRSNQWKILSINHPTDEVINSVILLERI